jgi:hypothetical protein
MTAIPSPTALDRHSEIGELSGKVRLAIKRVIVPLAILLAIEAGHLGFKNQSGTGAFVMMSLATCIALFVWGQCAIGLPLLPMMAVQSLIIYGVPIVVGHESILTYRSSFVFQAGVEVLVFELAMTAAWRAGMMIFRPSPPISYALQEFNRSGVKGWSRLGFILVVAAAAIQLLQGLDFAAPLFAMLPPGSGSILYALLSVASACGFFLVSMVVGGTEASPIERLAFWVLLVVNGMIMASGLLLSVAAANLITVAIGFFWSNGRIPWRYLIFAMLALSFLNTGKYAMRSRYWATDESSGANISPMQLPELYSEWVQASYDAILENKSTSSESQFESVKSANKNQTLLDRIDNLQNELFIIDAIQAGHEKPLEGATYTLIPPLLMPRIFWPNKPRSHEGQLLLNVHFGRQDLESTYTTYVAWGLLPEAYANFGPILGSVFLGCFLGLLFAWIENLSALKLVMSLEGFLALNILMSLMNSFEMVASVLVTSTFQSMVVIAGASIPFVHRTLARRPVDD